MSAVEVMAEREAIRVHDGKIHLRFIVDGRKVKDERCNLGQVEVEVLTPRQLEEADPSVLCDYCFNNRS